MQSSDTQPTVLVVEHDTWERKFTTDVLANQGYFVLGASNGASGLRLAEQNVCDAILLDFTLPEVTGIEVLQRLKTMDRTRAIPVIALGESPAGQAVLTEGCVPKPLNETRVLSELGRCLRSAT
jgi:CheY-like chemotaxis protein